MNKFVIGLLKTLLLLVFTVTAASCDGKKDTAATPVAQDSMLLRDLDQASRNTAAAVDTSPVIVRDRSDADDPSLVDVGGTPTTATPPRVTPAPSIATGPATPRATPSPSVTPIPRVTPPRRATDAPAPSVVPAATVTPRSDDPCTLPAQSAQRQCILISIARSDAPLNNVYQELIREIRRSGSPEGSASEQRLREAQREWLVYRDTECRRRTRDREGDLWAPVRAKCLGDFSAVRTTELRQNLRDIRGR